MALLIGGVQMGDQVKALEKGVDVLIATPGRLMDLFGRGKIMLNGCNLLVIDEADRMLDMGFIPDIEEICSKLPKQRQTLLFSATMPPPIKKLADKFLTDPKTIEVARPATANVNIEQRLVEVRARQEARRAARHPAPRGIQERDRLLQPQDDGARARDQPQALGLRGRPDPGRHGPVATASPSSTASRSDEITILVASDVAARGLDVKGVSHVINFDVPWQPDDYIHRIGRTGRAGHDGHRHHAGDREDAEAVAGDREADRPQDPAGRGDSCCRRGRATAPAAPKAREAGRGHKPAAEPQAERPSAKPTKRRDAAAGQAAARASAKPPADAERKTAPAPSRSSRHLERLSGTGRCPSFLSFGADLAPRAVPYARGTPPR